MHNVFLNKSWRAQVQLRRKGKKIEICNIHVFKQIIKYFVKEWECSFNKLRISRSWKGIFLNKIFIQLDGFFYCRWFNIFFKDKICELLFSHFLDLEIESALPKIGTAFSEIETGLPQIETALSEIETARLQRQTGLSEIESDLPEIETALPEIETALTQIETVLSEI